jgi:hypothetical protein
MKTQTQKSYRVVVETTRKFKDERQVMATSIEEAENYVQLPKAGENYIGDSYHQYNFLQLLVVEHSFLLLQ